MADSPSPWGDVSKLPQDDLGPVLFWVQLGLTIFSFVTICGRLYIRCILVRAPGLDDLFICIGWLFLCAVTTLMCIACANLGLGKHAWNLTPVRMLDWVRLQTQVVWMHQWALVFTRISILTFYLRLSSLRKFRNIVYTVMGFNAAWAVITLIVTINACTPPRKAWLPDTPGSCFFVVPWLVSTSVINICLDISVYVTPIPMLRALQVSYKQKIALFATFGLGFFACISSVMRVPALVKVLKTTDYEYDLFDICLWSTVELNVGIFCASIPTFKALLRHLPGRNTVAASSMGYSKAGGGTSKFNRSTMNQSVIGNDQHGNLNSYSLSYVQRRDNESEEHIVVPQGKIMAKTDINIYTEERTLDDEEQGKFKKSSPTDSLRSSPR